MFVNGVVEVFVFMEIFFVMLESVLNMLCFMLDGYMVVMVVKDMICCIL